MDEVNGGKELRQDVAADFYDSFNMLDFLTGFEHSQVIECLSILAEFHAKTKKNLPNIVLQNNERLTHTRDIIEGIVNLLQATRPLFLDLVTQYRTILADTINAVETTGTPREKKLALQFEQKLAKATKGWADEKIFEGHKEWVDWILKAFGVELKYQSIELPERKD